MLRPESRRFAVLANVDDAHRLRKQCGQGNGVAENLPSAFERPPINGGEYVVRRHRRRRPQQRRRSPQHGRRPYGSLFIAHRHSQGALAKFGHSR